ncbi:MAG: hypothetical protein ACI4VF_07290 [Lachnospirales bacterium]
MSGIWKKMHIGYMSGGTKGLLDSGFKVLGSAMLAHPVITAIASLAAIGWGLDKFVFTADEKFETAQKSVSEISKHFIRNREY